ncbi:hypothetical protein N9955_00730 [bacterium]|nr:hypothetical protein [bacterium]
MNDLPIRFPNYEDCLIGVCQSFNNVVYVYDKEKILDKIKAQTQCDHKDALNFFDANINKNFGKRGPAFFSRIDDITEI